MIRRLPIAHARSMVSVIIPGYTYAYFITHAIENIRTQAHVHVDIIAAYDGSTDVSTSYLMTIRILYTRNKRMPCSHYTRPMPRNKSPRVPSSPRVQHIAVACDTQIYCVALLCVWILE